MKKILSSIIVIATCLLIAGHSTYADVITLKDGTTVEGTITEKNSESVTISYAITPRIFDLRVISRADIESIDETRPEDKIFEEIKKLSPTPDLATTADYDKWIDRLIKPFQNKYPNFSRRYTVKHILNSLIAERKKVATGFTKINKVWITPIQQKENPYHWHAYKIMAKMHQAENHGNHLGALRLFDMLYCDYTISDAFRESLDNGQNLLNIHLKAANALLVTAKKNQNDEKSDSKTEHEKLLLNSYKNRIALQSAAGIRFVDLDELDPETIKNTLSLIDTVKKELSTLDLKKLSETNELLNNARRFALGKQRLRAEEELKKAREKTPIPEKNISEFARLDKLMSKISEEFATEENTETPEKSTEETTK